jgi:hypothetical protein
MIPINDRSTDVLRFINPTRRPCSVVDVVHYLNTIDIGTSWWKNGSSNSVRWPCSAQDFKKTDDIFNRVLGEDSIAVICLMERHAIHHR